MKHLSWSLLFVFLFTSCSPAATPTPNLPKATAVIATATPTLIPSPTPSPTPQFPVHDGGVLSPGTTIISKDNVSQLTELALWGKGVAKNIVWADDGASIMVETTIGSYSYYLESFQLISEKSGRFIETGQKISLSVDGYNFNNPSGGFDVKVYDNKKSQSVGSFRIEDGWGRPNITYLPESDLIVIERDFLGIQLLDGSTYKIFDTISRIPYGEYPSTIAVSKNRKAEAIGKLNGKILLRLKVGDSFSDSFNLETEGPVRILSFSPDGTKLASESGGDILIWDVSTGQKIGIIPETFMSGDFFNDLQTWRGTGHISISDNKLAIADYNIVNIFNLYNGKKETRYAYPAIYEDAYLNADGTKRPETFYFPVHDVFFSSDEKYLMSTLSTSTMPSSGNGFIFDRIHIRDLSSGQVIQSMDQDTFMLTASTYSAAEHLFMIGDPYKSSIRIWNVDDGSNMPSIIAWKSRQLSNMDGTRRLSISPNGKLVLSWSSLDGVANLWEVKSQQKIMAIKIPACNYSECRPGAAFAAISPDNKKLILTLYPYDSHIAAVYSIPDGQELYRLSSRYSVFSPNGTMIAGSGDNNKILFYDAETGAPLGEKSSHSQSGIQLPYFSQDGKSLTAISTNGTIGVWGIP